MAIDSVVNLLGMLQLQLHYTTQRATTLQYTALHYTTHHYTSLHTTTDHYTQRYYSVLC